MRKTPWGWIQIGESRIRGVARIPLGLKPSRDSRATSQRDSPIWIQPLGVFCHKTDHALEQSQIMHWNRHRSCIGTDTDHALEQTDHALEQTQIFLFKDIFLLTSGAPSLLHTLVLCVSVWMRPGVWFAFERSRSTGCLRQQVTLVHKTHHTPWIYINFTVNRDHFCVCTQPMRDDVRVQCNVVSHWLSPYTKWSLCEAANPPEMLVYNGALLK